MNIENNVIPKNAIARSFSLAAQSYDQNSFVQQEIAKRLLARLDYINITPQNILDIGSGTGSITNKLANRFPQANIISLDLSYNMLGYAKNNQKFLSFYVCNDAETLAIKNNSVDFIFSSCSFQWIPNLPGLFSEISRVLTKDGLLLFSTLGPDTLIELKSCFASIDDYKHVNSFIDLHKIGDVMLNCKLTDPVVDMEKIVFQYKNIYDLLGNLKGTGAKNLDINRNKGCFTRALLEKLTGEYNKYKTEEKLPVTFEVIYGHAWGKKIESDNFYFDINKIKKM
jgi:malonyl-CoA O-methyltransferase